MIDLDVTRSKAPPRMLVADDDPAVVGLLVDRCGKMGFVVETATNGLQMFIKARINRPDVLIIDVNMPELDGLSACVRLLESGRDRFDAIVITGSADVVTPERCESLGLFYGRKGPEFWKSIESALTEIFPDLAGNISGLEARSKGVTLKERPRVLLIDDDPGVVVFLSSRLGKFGVDLVYASDAIHGCRLAATIHPTVIVTDYSMPDGDAEYLLRRLRSSKATCDIPVIVISGRQLDGTLEHRLRRDIDGRPGAAYVFRKEFNTDELFSALRKYCGFGVRGSGP